MNEETVARVSRIRDYLVEGMYLIPVIQTSSHPSKQRDLRQLIWSLVGLNAQEMFLCGIFSGGTVSEIYEHAYVGLVGEDLPYSFSDLPEPTNEIEVARNNEVVEMRVFQEAEEALGDRFADFEGFLEDLVLGGREEDPLCLIVDSMKVKYQV